MKNWNSILIALIIGGILGWFLTTSKYNLISTQPKSSSVNNLASSKAQDLKTDMRKLWEDHITWTRAYIVSAAYDNKDADAVSKRLLKNQEDIGDAIKPYYGTEAGNKLTELLKTHITTAVDLVTAVKKDDKDAQNSANDKWYANANEIADFLAGANPNWPKDQLRAEMKDHLDITKQEAVDILQNKYGAGVDDYDKVHEQILKMSDMLSSGIVKQYPDKFK